MAPFRNRDRSNRSGRGQVEHNVLDGLPIQQYKEVDFHVAQSTAENKLADKDALWPELPMPRESHLLPEHSQQLLRAARAGKVFKAPAPPEEDRENMDEEEEQKDIPKGFTVKKWIKVARHLEEPETEYLAKRRKGLPSHFAPTGGHAPVPAAPLRETIVKKLDSEGNVSVYKALVPEGQTIEGEVQPTEAATIEAKPAAAVPGTVIEGVGVVNADGVVVVGNADQTPARRKPPPPKKKVKKLGGPGRGKKKVVFVEGQAEQGTPASVASTSEHLTVPSGKPDAASIEPSEGGDTPMPDAGDEEEEGEDESDEEEGEDKAHSPGPAKSATPSNAPTEPTAVPIVEMIDRPAIDPVTEPSIVTVTEAGNTSVMEPVIQANVDIVAEAIVEPQPVPSVVPSSATSVVQPIVQTTLESIEEPVLQSVIEHAAESVIDTIPKPDSTPAVDPVVDQIVDNGTKDIIDPAVSVVDPAPEPAIGAIADVSVPPAVESVVSSESEPPISLASTVDKAKSPPPPIATEPSNPTDTSGDAMEGVLATTVETEITKGQKDPSSSPELPLSAISHSRQNSLNQIPTLQTLDSNTSQTLPTEDTGRAEAETETDIPSQSTAPPTTSEPVGPPASTDIAEPPVPEASKEASTDSPAQTTPQPKADAPSVPPERMEEEPDLLGSLEAHLAKDSVTN